MKILLKYHARLSEIIRIFPIAERLAKQKHSVFIETDSAFSSILGLIDYAQPWPKNKAPAEGEIDAIHDLQINPRRSHQYRTENPPKKFLDFLAAEHPAIAKGVSRDINFTTIPDIEATRQKYRLPKEYSLACPVPFSFAVQRGFSNLIPIEFHTFESWLHGTIKPRGDVHYLIPQGFRPNRKYLAPTDLADLAPLIAGALDFATINCAATVIASARVGAKKLREKWHHVSPAEQRERAQDDLATKEQTRWELAFDIPPRIKPQRVG